MKSGNMLYGVGGVVLLLVVLAVVTRVFFFTYTDEHHVAVFVERGNVQEERESGYNFTLPIVNKIVEIPRTLQEEKIEGVSASSSDSFTIANSIIEYDYVITDASHVYENYPDYRQRLQSTANNAAKQVLGDIRMQDIPRQRGEIGVKIAERMQQMIGEDAGIQIAAADLAGYTWDNHAKRVLSRQQETEADRQEAEDRLEEQKLQDRRAQQRADAEAKRRETESVADAEAVKREARAEAEADLARAEAESERLRMIAEVLQNNPELIEYQRVNNWDGKLSTVTGGNVQSRFMFDMED